MKTELNFKNPSVLTPHVCNISTAISSCDPLQDLILLETVGDDLMEFLADTASSYLFRAGSVFEGELVSEDGDSLGYPKQRYVMLISRNIPTTNDDWALNPHSIEPIAHSGPSLPLMSLSDLLYPIANGRNYAYRADSPVIPVYPDMAGGWCDYSAAECWRVVCLPLRADADNIARSFLEKSVYDPNRTLWLNFWHMMWTLEPLCSVQLMSKLIVVKSALAFLRSGEPDLNVLRKSSQVATLRLLSYLGANYPDFSFAKFIEEFIPVTRYDYIDMMALEKFLDVAMGDI
jgi:hypothetical protein